MRKPTIVDQIMNEHIPLMGAPQIVVTRAWAYHRYQQWGMPMHTGKFDSADFAAFSGPVTAEPLTDLSSSWAVSLLAALEGEIRG